MATKNYLRVYACGGTAANIVHKHRDNDQRGVVEEGQPETQWCFLDTSKANLHPQVNPDEVYVVGGTGSGSVRAHNYDAITNASGDVLDEFPPLLLNVVLFSGAGGTGSMFGPIMIRELASRGEAVIGLMVGAGNSLKAAQNTRATLQTLDNFTTSTLNVPVVLFYESNDATSFATVDSRMCVMLRLLETLMASGPSKHVGLDESDVKNWIRYTEALDREPCLSFVDVYVNDRFKSVDAPAVSVLSLVREADDVTSLGASADYVCFGVTNAIENDDARALHYVIMDDSKLMTEYAALDARIRETEKRQATTRRGTRISSGANSHDDGIIL